ncbi:MAG: phage tail protein [Kofleriaceae bacterium]
MEQQLLNRRVVRVPDVVGRALPKARITLEDAGLSKIVVLYRESYEDRDTVLEQRPTRGQMIYEGTEVTIWVARRGLLENLPAIYRRSDAAGRNLVRDVCFVFEHMFDSVDTNLVDGWRFYDPYVTPIEFLNWLSRWTAFTLDLDWPEAQKRALIKRAVDLYRIRGTRRGLALFLRLFSDHEPDIEENRWPFRGFRVEPEGAEDGARIGIDSVILPPVDLAHCFIVSMPIKFDTVTPEMVIRIHQIIAMEKPAHTHYYLQFAEEKGDVELREFFQIGMRSGIGIGAEVIETIEESGEAKK